MSSLPIGTESENPKLSPLLDKEERKSFKLSPIEIPADWIDQNSKSVFSKFIKEESHHNFVSFNDLEAMLIEVCRQRGLQPILGEDVEFLANTFNYRNDGYFNFEDWGRILEMISGRKVFDRTQLTKEAGEKEHPRSRLSCEPNKNPQLLDPVNINTIGQNLASSALLFRSVGPTVDCIEPIKFDEKQIQTAKSISEAIESPKLLEIKQLSFVNIIYTGLLNSMPRFDRSMINALAYFIMNDANENDTKAYFGLYNMYRTLFLWSFCRSLELMMSISSSQCLAQGTNRSLARKYFTNTLLIFICHICLFYIPVMYFGSQIFHLTGIDIDICQGFTIVGFKNLPADICDGLKLFVMGFCNTQKVQTVFVTITWINMIFFFGVTLSLSFYWDWGFDGWVVGKTVYQLLNLICCIYIYLKRNDKDIKGFCTIKEACKGFGSYTCHCFIFYVSSFVGWLGWEIGTVLTAMTNDLSQIAAYGSMINVASIIFDANSGFALIARTGLNLLLGAGFPKAAKRFTLKIIGTQSFVGVLFGIAMFSFRRQIADFYASNDQTQYDLIVGMLVYYSFMMQADTNDTLICMACRSVNHVYFMMIAMTICSVFMNFAVGWYIRFELNANCVPAFFGQYICMATSLSVCLAKILWYDWKKVKLLSK